MDADAWDERYAATEPVWTADPNVWVDELLGQRPPGTALDLAAGEGRHALWLAQLGWQVTAVDFAAKGLERGKRIAQQNGLSSAITWTVADVVHGYWPAGPYDAVLVSYLHLACEDRGTALRRAAAAVGPGGVLVIVGHDSANIEHGHGGPQDPVVLYNADDLIADLDGTGLTIQIAEVRKRQVPGADRPALDVVLLAIRAG